MTWLVVGCGDQPPDSQAPQTAPHAEPKSPDAAAAAESLADARELLGVGAKADPRKALADLTTTFGATPSDPEAAFLMARAAFRSEEPARCRTALDAYFAHEPTDHADWSAEAFVLRGWLLEHEGRPAEALPHYEKALEVSPNYAWAMHRKGCALADTGDVPGAIDWVEKAIARRPGLLEAHFTLARLYRRADRAADAGRETAIHRLLNQTSDNAATTGDAMSEKYAAYEQLEQLLPQWIEGRLVLTRMQLKLGRRELARERLKKLVAEHPDCGEAKALLESLARAPRDGERR